MYEPAGTSVDVTTFSLLLVALIAPTLLIIIVCTIFKLKKPQGLMIPEDKNLVFIVPSGEIETTAWVEDDDFYDGGLKERYLKYRTSIEANDMFQNKKNFDESEMLNKKNFEQTTKRTNQLYIVNTHDLNSLIGSFMRDSTEENNSIKNIHIHQKTIMKNGTNLQFFEKSPDDEFKDKTDRKYREDHKINDDINNLIKLDTNQPEFLNGNKTDSRNVDVGFSSLCDLVIESVLPSEKNKEARVGKMVLEKTTNGDVSCRVDESESDTISNNNTSYLSQNASMKTFENAKNKFLIYYINEDRSKTNTILNVES